MPGTSAVQPEAAEYAPYYSKYVARVGQGEIAETLNKQLETSLAELRKVSEEQGNFRYAPDKWSVKELLGHMIDAERIFAYRALRFARNDQSPLSGFEQDDYVLSGGFGRRKLSDLISEFEYVRRANIAFFRSLDEAAWLRRGPANDAEITVRALAYIMAGHELHHMEVLRERYLKA
jgi:hypothetical protein